jgi:DNA-binding transcriptional MerR regulator
MHEVGTPCINIAEKKAVGWVASSYLAQARGIYSIGAISRMLGLSQATIRSWEDRYGLIVAERSEGGRRLYSRDQLEQLQFVKQRLDEGLSAADAHRLLEERRAGAQPVAELRESPESSEPARPEPKQAAAEPRAPTPGRFLVLLADSDRLSAELNDAVLRSEGYDVEVALSVQEAEEKFATGNPALSIVELMISGGVGLELCERLKQRRATPVVCISSLDLREQALAAGADAFLIKPLQPPQLVSTVDELVGHRGPTAELGAR